MDVRIEKKGASESKEPQAAKYEVNGYHDTRTSIHIPHKFELPDGGAKKGDSIVANFRLVSGSYFKIAGLAFCRYEDKTQRTCVRQLTGYNNRR